ncbi:MAG TPA: type II toxin-antitoxin system RelE/ParE family toxin [Nitrolancea sp.]|nr:type II toxin-antitoxin system RelE/ParE family toxin [Nitrolancea sp.]
MMPSDQPEGQKPPSVYDIQLTRAAAKDLKQLRSHSVTVAQALNQLRTNPAAGHVLQGSLAGVRTPEFTVKGSGAGRAAYVVLAEHRVCLVFIIGPHEGFYERAERRAATLDPPG